MKQNALKSTTAMLVVLSFAQPLPGTAQSSSSALPRALLLMNSEEWLASAAENTLICIEEGIDDARACERFIDLRDATTASDGDVLIDATAEQDAANQEADTNAANDAAAARVRENAEAEADAEIEADAAARAAAESAVTEDAAETETTAEAEASTDVDVQAKTVETDPDAAESAANEATEDAETIVEAEPSTDVEMQADSSEIDAAKQARMEEQARANAQAEADALAEEAISEIIAAADTATDEPAEITSEVLTEDTRRSSSEEFQDLAAESLAQETNEQTSAPAAPRDNELSDLERAGLLALGAVAVGAILLNGQRVEAKTGDRVIVVDDAGTYTVLKDDDALLRTPGSEVRTERFADGSTRSVVIREDGTRIITVRDVNGRALRRVRVDPNGHKYLLIDETREFQPVIVSDLPPPIRQTTDYQAATDRDSLRLALLAADERDLGRSFSLRQVRDIADVRALAPEIDLAGITFETNSAAIAPAEAERLRDMGLLMRDLVRDNPTELFPVEGHTDAIGDAGYNLLLSDRRAESVALACSEYFGVAGENIIVQGYGEKFMKVPTQSAERLNRRVSVRRITTLVRPY